MPLFQNNKSTTLLLGTVGDSRKIYTVPGKGSISGRGLRLDTVDILEEDLNKPAVAAAIKNKLISSWEGLKAGDVKAAGAKAVAAPTPVAKTPVPDLSKGISGGEVKTKPAAKAPVAKGSVAKGTVAKGVAKASDKGANGATAGQ